MNDFCEESSYQVINEGVSDSNINIRFMNNSQPALSLEAAVGS